MEPMKNRFYDRLVEAARHDYREALAAREAGGAPDSSAVPVWIPVENKEGATGPVSGGAFSVFLEIIGGVFVRETAADPDHPTTAEIADAESLLAYQYFDVVPFPVWPALPG